MTNRFSEVRDRPTTASQGGQKIGRGKRSAKEESGKRRTSNAQHRTPNGRIAREHGGERTADKFIRRARQIEVAAEAQDHIVPVVRLCTSRYLRQSFRLAFRASPTY